MQGNFWGFSPATQINKRWFFSPDAGAVVFGYCLRMWAVFVLMAHDA